MSIKLEVSLGEALDKLSILEIKYQKINDNRKKNVEIEYKYLKKELSNYLQKLDYFYKILKKINLEIWELQDDLRKNNVDKDNFYIICDEILNLNDSRYLVKKKLNEVCSSKLKEEKGYELRNLNIILNIDEETLNYLNGAVRYYSFYYDNIDIFCNNDIYDYMVNIFHDDLFIKIHKFDNLNNEIKNDIDNLNIENFKVSKNMTHSYFKNKNFNLNNDNKNYPHKINKLYDDLNLNIKICREYKYESNN